MATLLNDLVDRRVPQYVALYLGISWGLVQFADFMVEEFLLSPHWTRIALAVVALLFPSAVLIAYLHGKKGRDRWGRVEKIGVPANLILAIAVLFLAFAGLDLGAAAVTVTVENEEGEAVERLVPKPEFRKRTALFAFDLEGTLEEDQSWLSLLVPQAVLMDLAGDSFFDPVHTALFQQRLKHAGFDDLTGVPLPLKLEIAEEVHASHLFSGSVGRSEEGFVVTTRTYGVGRGSLLAEHRYEGGDLLELADRASADLHRDLEIPRRDDVRDLPVAERLTPSAEALEAYGRGIEALTVRTAWAEAIEHFEEAARADPSFASAHYGLSTALIFSNRSAEALRASAAALEHLYRLPERMQFLIKADHYYLAQDTEKALAVIEMWAELYPDDHRALTGLAQVQMIRNHLTEAIQTSWRIYELNPASAEMLKQIAGLHQRLGEYEEARAALEEYAERFPEDATGFQALADLARTTGDHELARRNLDRAIVLDPGNADLLRSLASVELDEGRYSEAKAVLEQALQASRTPQDRVASWSALQSYHHLRGELRAALEAMERRVAEAETFQPAFLQLGSRINDFDLYVETGQRMQAKALVERMRHEFQGPFEFLQSMAEVTLAVQLKDLEAAEAALPRARAAESEQAQLRPGILGLEGEIAELREDWSSALAAYRAALEEAPSRLGFRVAMARCQRHLGQLEEAEVSIRDAVARRASPKSRVELARVLVARGDRDGAVEQLRLSLEAWANADSGFEPAGEASALLERLEG